MGSRIRRLEEADDVTSYTPEALAAARRSEERELVREGIELWRAKKEESLRQRQCEQLQLRRMLADYWPWSRPGGGAFCASALRKRNVPLEAPPSFDSMYSLDRQSWQRYGPGSHRGAFESSCRAFEPSSDLGAAGRHYDSSCGRSSPRKQQQQPRAGIRRHGAAIDATRPGCTIDSWRAFNAADRCYVADLTDQIRRKQEKAMEEQRLEGESSRRHFDTWCKLWGRPGHGAPIDQARRRNNLHDVLYRSVAAAI